MKKQKTIFIIIVIFFIIISILYYKSKKNGNNISKSIEDLKDYILNISSYEAEAEIEVISNKNTNKYIIKQWYASPNIYKQEVQSPEYINGLITIYDGSDLKIQNSKLDLQEIYSGYQYLSKNILSLKGFIERCKEVEPIYDEKDDEVIIGVTMDQRYIKYQELTIDKRTNKPIRMEIMDENKKTLVYILYKEITINKTTKEDII